jgi:hypothetical protein
VCRGKRPGPQWHGHGYTTKELTLLHEHRLVAVSVHKQRWRDTDRGATVHDRPPRDVSWARYGLAVVLAAAWCWMSGPRGLHHVQWPWSLSTASTEEERPSRRTVQRWMARLLPDALGWQVAIRDVAADHLVPSTLEEMFPTGVSPPGTVARWRRRPAQAEELSRGLVMLNECAPPCSIAWSALLVEARRRFLAAQQH